MAALLAATAATVSGCSSGAALTATISDATPDFSCEAITVPAHTLTDGRLASELSAAGRRTVLQTEGVTRANLETWRIVEDSSARVTIIRPLDQPERVGDRVIASHQYVDRTPYRKADLARSQWTMSIPLTCTLRELVDPAPPPAAPAAARAKAPTAEAPAVRAPAVKAPAVKAPAVKAPAVKAPKATTGRAPATRPPTGRAPAVKAPAARTPAVKAPPAAPPGEKTTTLRALPEPTA